MCLSRTRTGIAQTVRPGVSSPVDLGLLRIDGSLCPTRKAASPPRIASPLARDGPDRCALDVDEAVAVRPANTFWWKTLRLDHSVLMWLNAHGVPNGLCDRHVRAGPTQ